MASAVPLAHFSQRAAVCALCCELAVRAALRSALRQFVSSAACLAWQVLGGSFISRYLSERVIGIVGGVLFLAFAATTAVGLF